MTHFGEMQPPPPLDVIGQLPRGRLVEVFEVSVLDGFKPSENVSPKLLKRVHALNHAIELFRAEILNGPLDLFDTAHSLIVPMLLARLYRATEAVLHFTLQSNTLGGVARQTSSY